MQLRVNAPQALHRIGQDREEGDNPSDYHQSARYIVKADPYENKRRNGHDGRDLQGDDIWIKRHFNQPRPGENNRQPNSAHCGPEKCRRRDFYRDPKRLHQRGEIIDQRRANGRWGWQNKHRNRRRADPNLPKGEECHAEQNRGEVTHQPVPASWPSALLSSAQAAI